MFLRKNLFCVLIILLFVVGCASNLSKVEKMAAGGHETTKLIEAFYNQYKSLMNDPFLSRDAKRTLYEKVRPLLITAMELNKTYNDLSILAYQITSKDTVTNKDRIDLEKIIAEQNSIFIQINTLLTDAANLITDLISSKSKK